MFGFGELFGEGLDGGLLDDWREGADLGENGVGVVEGLLEGLEELVGLEAPLH